MNEEKGKLARLFLGAGSAYAVTLLGWLLLYMYNGYVQIVDGKTALFGAVTVCAAVAVVYNLIRCPNRPRLRWYACELWLAGLCLLYVVNLLWSQDPAVSFWGLAGRRNGTCMLLLCAMCYLLVRIGVRQGDVPLLLQVFLGASCCAALLAWLNYFMMDPLSVYYSLQPGEDHMFLSTLGNINFFGGLMSMAAPVALYGCTRAHTQSAVYAWGAVSVLLCSALVPANSDGPWLGFVVGVAVLLCLKRTDTRMVGRLLTISAVFFVCAALVGWVSKTAQVRGELRTISAWLCQPVVALPGVFLCGVLAFLLSKRRPVVCARFFRWSALCVVLALLALVVAVNAGLVDGGAWRELLLFSPQWGSGRGYVWSVLTQSYVNELSVLEKIAGVGAEGVNALLNPLYTNQIVELNGRSFDSAHNVYLQHLICAGAVGLLCWCGFWLGRLRCAWRRCAIFAAPLAAYCVQAFFSIDTPAVLVPAIVFAALTAVPAGEGKEKKTVLSGAVFLCFAGMVLASLLL